MKKIIFLLLPLFQTNLPAQSNPDTIYTLDNEVRIETIDSNFWNHPFKERIGEIATPWEAKDYEGRLHSSEMYAGKILILHFWNVWDWDSCIKVTEALNHISNEYWKDVIVISFVRETIGLEELAFLHEHPVSFIIIPQAAEFGMEYHGGKFGTPLTFFIDREGNWHNIGRNPDAFEMWVKELLK